MKRVAVLRGGAGTEYDLSMRTGNAVLSALVDSVYPYRDIVVTQSGQWLAEGKKLSPDQALEGIDVVFVALQSACSQNSQVQQILERKKIPYTGSRIMSAQFTQNKELAKQTMRSSGIATPKHRRIGQLEKNEIQKELEQIIIDLGTSLYIKPLRSKSPATYRSVGEVHELEQNLVEMLDMYDDLIVEQKVAGIPAQVGVLGDFRKQTLYTLPAHELVDDYIRPGRFTDEVKTELARIARLAHVAMGCDQYSLVDFVVNKDEIIFLKIDTHPELCTDRHFASSTEAIGLSHQDLIYHLIETAITK